MNELGFRFMYPFFDNQTLAHCFSYNDAGNFMEEFDMIPNSVAKLNTLNYSVAKLNTVNHLTWIAPPAAFAKLNTLNYSVAKLNTQNCRPPFRIFCCQIEYPEPSADLDCPAGCHCEIEYSEILWITLREMHEFRIWNFGIRPEVVHWRCSWYAVPILFTVISRCLRIGSEATFRGNRFWYEIYIVKRRIPVLGWTRSEATSQRTMTADLHLWEMQVFYNYSVSNLKFWNPT